MDKGHTVPKWVLIVRPKIPQMPQNLSAQFVGPSPKVMDSNEKRLNTWFQNRSYFLEYVVLRITKLSLKLSTYRWDTLYMICYEINLLLLLQPWKSIT